MVGAIQTSEQSEPSLDVLRLGPDPARRRRRLRHLRNHVAAVGMDQGAIRGNVLASAQWATAFAAAVAVALLCPRMWSLRAGHRPAVILSRIYVQLPGLLAGAAAGARHGRSSRLRCYA
jgi:hypothetical protein